MTTTMSRGLGRGVATQGRHAHVHSVGRRYACRLGERLHTSGSRGRQGGEVITLPFIRLLAFHAILAGCAKALDSSSFRRRTQAWSTHLLRPAGHGSL
jgi:hypothetical protein